MSDSEVSKTIKNFATGYAGTVYGGLLAWMKWHSVTHLIWPILFGWFYPLYFVIRYGTQY